MGNGQTLLATSYYHQANMKLKIYKDYRELSDAAATLILDTVKTKPEALLCFATGDSPRLTYQLIVEKARQEGVDFSRCFMIGLDEWMGVPPGNSGSCHYFLHEYLFDPLGIKDSQIHLFDAFAQSEESECGKMDRVIAGKGGIDLVVVGVGLNGHIGFNEPGTSLASTAHFAELEEITKTIGQKYFADKVTIGKGITVGLKQVMEAATLIMLANGSKKSPVIKKAVEDPVGIAFPATLMRHHRNSYLMVDEDAASALKKELP